ncbi:hypothetical protein E1B28_005817 [Marasmius oreades]|uniref:Phytase-like domain-containing protein n=1 Tax=Marasmius oreades TaxID=181124 RepID=A0A9P7S628_9AGAR|nr:uncharacterized protein E1B28_005817 [Marasmius oreades]KAG7095023.1 hypothetical protein E1B28_005817 [Marasmius oreades]
MALFKLGFFVVIACLSASSTASPTSIGRRSVTVTLDGVNYVNKGLVGFGLIPHDFKESTGDSLGGIGSAIALKRGTWAKGSNGTYTGTLLVRPDRGHNIDTTIDYQSRQHEIEFVLTPYTGSENLNFGDAQKTLQLTYKNTTLMFERNNTKTSGLDALAVRPTQGSDPELPIPSEEFSHLSLDVEGLVAAPDGTFWISDEYGPYIYHFSDDGHLVSAIQPPAAILPKDKNGNINFTSVESPTTGRSPNQGFEGLTLDPENNILYAMLQSATIQDGGDDESTSSFTRMVAYNISDDSKQPPLVGEWVIPLPVSNDKGKTRPSSEITFVSENIFLSLSRDGKGMGNDDSESKYKQADLFSIAHATNIQGMKFDDPSNPVAPNGKLDKSITPAKYVSFVDYLNDDDLKRFGLHNGGNFDETLIDSKWESLALAPVNDPKSPDDYFLFTVADNDFLTTKGVALGIPYDAGIDVNNQFMVFRVTLPRPIAKA